MLNLETKKPVVSGIISAFLQNPSYRENADAQYTNAIKENIVGILAIDESDLPSFYEMLEVKNNSHKVNEKILPTLEILYYLFGLFSIVDQVGNFKGDLKSYVLEASESAYELVYQSLVDAQKKDSEAMLELVIQRALFDHVEYVSNGDAIVRISEITEKDIPVLKIVDLRSTYDWFILELNENFLKTPSFC